MFANVYLATEELIKSFAYHDMSPKGIIIKELALVSSIAWVFHFSSDYNVPGENPDLCSHVYTIGDLTHVQELRGFWLTWARDKKYFKKEHMKHTKKTVLFILQLQDNKIYCLLPFRNTSESQNTRKQGF